MRIPILLLLAAACLSAWSQQGFPLSSFGSKATPADLSVSCRVNEAARIVDMTITNRTAKGVYFRRTGPPLDYVVSIATSGGKPLVPPPKRRPLPPVTISSTVIPLDPKEELVEKAYLSALADIPKQGGKFRIRIGRVLFSVPDDPLKPDPSEMLWCKPMDVTFPPLK